MIKLMNDWDGFLETETKKDYYKDLRKFLKSEYSKKIIYPPAKDIFNAFKLTPLSKTKVVILGQDPYINAGEAQGLAFSVNVGVKIPPSLKNIFKELSADLGLFIPDNGCLYKWARQGVLLLNTVLTVREKASKSHTNKGWEKFNAAVMEELNKKDESVVFLLWGNDAKSKAVYITNPRHTVLTSAHPSPLAGGKFFGCKHFSKTNEILKMNGLEEIDWQIENAEMI